MCAEDEVEETEIEMEEEEEEEDEKKKKKKPKRRRMAMTRIRKSKLKRMQDIDVASILHEFQTFTRTVSRLYRIRQINACNNSLIRTQITLIKSLPVGRGG